MEIFVPNLDGEWGFCSVASGWAVLRFIGSTYLHMSHVVLMDSISELRDSALAIQSLYGRCPKVVVNALAN